MAETSFLIKDVRVFTGSETIENGYVHISFGKIASLGKALPPPPHNNIPPNTKTFSKPGHTLIPGLIDAHNHATNADPQALRQALRFGVTTFMDMHNEIANVEKLRRQAEQERDRAADFKTAGLCATIEDGWPIPFVTAFDSSAETLAMIAKWPKLSTGESAKEFVRWAMEDVHVDYIKLMHESGKSLGGEYIKPSVALQKSVVDETHKYGKIAVAHALSLDDHIEVLSAGVDGLMHTFLDQPPTKELIDAYKKANAFLNPTLVAIGSLTEEGKPIAEKYAHDSRVKGMLDEAGQQKLCQCMSVHAKGSTWEYAIQSIAELKKAGIDIVAGSDAAAPAAGTAYGLTLHHEMALYVHKCGFTPTEALQSATTVTARRFGFEDRGRIAEGLRADLVLVEGNPLDDIDATLDLRGVWREGVLAEWYKEKI